MKKQGIGIAAAVFSVAVWSSTYISTKIIIQSYTALQISAIRFTLGLLLLCILAPPAFRGMKLKEELRTAATGFMGMFLYYFLENLATKYTYASNVSVIVTSIPLLTSILAPMFYKEETFSPRYAISFLLTMTGFLLILHQTGSLAGISGTGDILALCAAVTFALYTLLLRSLTSYASPLVITRKSFFYGWLCIMTVSLASNQLAPIPGIFKLQHTGHFLFLGLLASGVCFISWAYAVKRLGPVRSSQFIYLVPFLTVTLSIIILHEQLTLLRITGMAFIILAVILSQVKGLPRMKRKEIVSSPSSAGP